MMSLETKVLIGLAVGAVGVLAVAKLSAKPAPVVYTLADGIMRDVAAHPGDVLVLRSPNQEAIDVVQENAPGGVLSVAPIELNLARVTVVKAGVTSVTIEWGDTHVSMMAVSAT